MPRINLLPVKAAKRQDNARNEIFIMSAIFLVVCAGLYSWHAAVASITGELQEKVSVLEQELASLAKDVQRVEEFKKQAQILEHKLGVIETLKKRKVGPAKLLDDLATIITRHEKIWLTSLKEDGGFLTLEGGAMEHEDISDFQIALTRESKFFSEITLSVVNTRVLEGIRYLDWKLTCKANYAAG